MFDVPILGLAAGMTTPAGASNLLIEKIND